MIKEILSTVIVGGSCSTLAVLSTSFSSIDGDSGTTNLANYKKKEIKTIETFGDIEAFGRQKGCAYRIVDKTEEGKPKEYSLSEFSFVKEKEINDLQKDILEVAKKTVTYCGKDASVMAIFYVKEDKKPQEKPVKKIFRLQRDTALINNSNPIS